MANETGSPDDMAQRISITLPEGWFPDQYYGGGGTPQPTVLNALLAGFGHAFSCIFALIQFTISATRLTTSQGTFIDLWADDFFGPNGLPRNDGEPDAAYIARVRANSIGNRVTRAAVEAGLDATPLGGDGYKLVEPRRAADTKGLGTRGNGALGGGYGYGVPNLRYGSRTTPAQAFVVAQNATLTPAQAATVADRLAAGVRLWVQDGPQG